MVAQVAPAARWRLAPASVRFTFEHALLLITGGVLAYLVVGPFVLLLLTSLHVRGSDDLFALTLDNFVRVLSVGGGGAVLVNSFVFALGAASGAIAIGALLAWLVERTDSPLRGFVYTVMFVSLALPGIFKVVGWIVMLGPKAGLLNLALVQLLGPGAVLDIFSLGGMILVEMLLWTPTAFLLMVGPLRQMDPALEEAAHASGANRWQAFRRVTLPLMGPSILAIVILAFVRMLEAFEVPALIGLPGRTVVLTSRLYLSMTRGILPSHEEPSAYAMLLMLPVVLGLLVYLRMTRHAQKYQVITGKGFRLTRMSLGRWRGLSAALVLALSGVMLLPMLALLWASLLPFLVPPTASALSRVSLDNYAAVLAAPRVLGSVTNTLVVSGVSATAVMALVSVGAWVVIRSTLRARVLVDYLATAPLTFPGIVLALALVQIYLRVPIPIYNTLWILVLAFVTRYVPFAMRYASAGLLQIHKELEESAAISGARWHQSFARVTVPLVFPALFAGWVFVFLHACTELSASILLAGPRSQVASVLMFQLWQEGQVSEIGAFAVMFSVPLVGLALLLQRIAARFGIQG